MDLLRCKLVGLPYIGLGLIRLSVVSTVALVPCKDNVSCGSSELYSLAYAFPSSAPLPKSCT
jgi:hypothetical protein